MEEWQLGNIGYWRNNLNTARRHHGCTHFFDNSAEIIIVAGGYNSNDGYLRSVEKMKRSTTGGPWSLWMSIGNLPQKRYCIISLNVVYSLIV